MRNPLNLEKYIEMLKNQKNQNKLELFFYFKIIQEYLIEKIHSKNFRYEN